MATFPCFAVGDTLELLGCGAPVRPTEGEPLDDSLRLAAETVDPLLVALLFAGYFVERITLSIPKGKTKKTYSIDTRTWSVILAETLPWNPPPGEAVLALWTRPRYLWPGTQDFCLPADRFKSPTIPGVEIGFDAQLPGWLILHLGDNTSVSAAIATLARLTMTLRDQLIVTLALWHDGGAASPGLLRLFVTKHWGMPVGGTAGAYPALQALCQLSDQIAQDEDITQLLTRELAVDEQTVTLYTRLLKWSEADPNRPSPDAVLADLMVEILEIDTAHQDSIWKAGRPPARLAPQPFLQQTLTAALMLLHELGVIDLLRGLDELAAPLQSTPEDEERRYDWFHALLTTHVQRWVSEGTLPCKVPPVKFEESDGAVNIVGIRSMDEWKPKPRLTDAYNDWICVVWREGGRKRCLGWRMTAAPGYPIYAKTVTEEEKDDLSHLIDGQWRYFLGKHGKTGDGGYDAPEPKPHCILWWNNKSGSPFRRNEKIYGDGTYTANLHIHAGNTKKKVGRTSEGCQVFYGDTDHPAWTAFIKVIKAASNKDDMPYTLLDSAMLPDTSRLVSSTG